MDTTLSSPQHIGSQRNRIPSALALNRSPSHYSTSRKKRDKSHKHDTLLRWTTTPQNCLIVHKQDHMQSFQDLLDVSLYLLSKKDANVYLTESTFKQIKNQSLSKKGDKIKLQSLRILSNKYSNDIQIQDEACIGDNIHIIIVLGGDGPLLYLVSLFRDHQCVPPVVCFQRGHSGFLAPYQMENYQIVLDKLLDENEPSAIAIRMRLTARIWRHPESLGCVRLKSPNGIMHRSWSQEVVDHASAYANVSNAKSSCKVRSFSTEDEEDLKQSDAFEIKPSTADILFTKTQNIFKEHRCNDVVLHALNEVHVHRDVNASMMTATLFIDGDECTTIQADGMIFSTPTGSTAYNISAGGSLISPTVPCIALTPICPHTLSFRPVVVSDETIIHIQIPKSARSNAIISFDGRNDKKLYKGDVVEIIKCPYPVPTFKSSRFNVEWFQGLVSKFNWNLRQPQKSLDTNTINREEDSDPNDTIIGHREHTITTETPCNPVQEIKTRPYIQQAT
eukprot:263961_1